ncbi:MAG: Transcriptional regulator [Chthonomonadaceae bacterium]|nr:Transcriptional regulator [Chthonomonadaceae bacterium]
MLLERGKGRGRVLPTEAGRILYEGAKPLLNEFGELEARLRGLSDAIAGTVRVATVYSVGLHALPGRLKPFLARHPQVNVHLEYSQTDKVYRDVQSGAVDIGIVACPTERSAIEVLPFDEQEIALICAPEHALAHAPEVSLSQLENLPFIAFADDIPTRRLIDARLHASDTHVRVVMSVDNIETIKNLVEIGSGVALVPVDTVRQEVREGILAVVRLIPSQRFQRPSGMLVKRTGTRRAAVRAFLSEMQRT